MRVPRGDADGYWFSKVRRRFEDDRMPHELTFSCYHRFPFLDRDLTRIWFVEALQTCRLNEPIDLFAWVIMPEHVHLIVAPRKPGVPIGRIIGRVKESVSRKAVARLKEHSTEWLSRITVQEGKTTRHRFWQPGGGYDRNIDQETTLGAMIDYLHSNPVRRKLVERADEWEWSSARWYAGVRPVQLEMDPLPC